MASERRHHCRYTAIGLLYKARAVPAIPTSVAPSSSAASCSPGSSQRGLQHDRHRDDGDTASY
jgi:hypothetical protein